MRRNGKITKWKEDRASATPRTGGERVVSGITVALAVTALFLGFVAAAVYAGKLPKAVLGLYLGASVVAFLAYALDKSAARGGRWRTAESTLHGFGLIGGWPGALIAQKVLRHKTSKQPFKTLFWVTVVLNCSALGALLWYAESPAVRSADGALRSVFDTLSAKFDSLVVLLHR